MTTSLELVRIEGPSLPADRWRLASPFRIGRAIGNDLELPEPGISRRHASIEQDAEGWFVRDCSGRAGVVVNELAVPPSGIAVLRSGDMLGLGPWRFRIAAAWAEAPSESRAEAPTRINVGREIGTLAEQRLELILRYATDVARANDEASLAEVIAEHALLGSGYARATVIWQRGSELVVCCQRPQAASGTDTWQFNEELVASARAGDIADLEGAAADGSDGGPAPSRSQRAMCAPLMLDGYAQAFLYLDSERSSGRRYADAPTFCHALARLGSLALANLHRLEREREHAAFTADLDRARVVQSRLLPASSGRLGSVTYALRLHPGRVVAGDIVDIFVLGDGRVVAALGDVSGAGLGAGLVMASVQSFLRASFAHVSDPAQVVSLLNAHLSAQSSGGRFVTLWLGVFERDSANCRFVDAGHGHVLLMRNGTAQELSVRGSIPLGIDASAVFHTESLSLGAGETLLLYSDGIVEQRDAAGGVFGTNRLIGAMARCGDAQAAVDVAWQSVLDHAQGADPEDDATLLAISAC